MTPEDYLKKLGVEGNAILHEYMEGYAAANKEIDILKNQIASYSRVVDGTVKGYDELLSEAEKEIERLKKANDALDNERVGIKQQLESIYTHSKSQQQKIERLKGGLENAITIIRSNDIYAHQLPMLEQIESLLK